MEEPKSLKYYAKEAKKRMKSGFWKNYKENLKEELEKAKDIGLSESKVKEYYASKVARDIRSRNSTEEDFYQKVKKILDEEGEVSGILGRLTDQEEFNKMTYEEKQRYTLNLSERYLKAVERYKKEKAIAVTV